MTAALLALVFVVLLIVGLSWIASWYFWRWVIQLHDEPEPLPADSYGDIPHVPDAAKRLHPTKGYGWASRHGKRANG